MGYLSLHQLEYRCRLSRLLCLWHSGALELRLLWEDVQLAG